jgi:phage-related protein (TIGR01555 family)
MSDLDDLFSRQDSFLPGLFANAYTGQGTARDRSTHTEIQARRKLAPQEIDHLYEYHWMVQNLIDVLPDECTREWIEYQITGEDNAPDLIGQFIEYQDKLVDDVGDEISTADIFNEAMREERLTGGAAIYVDIDDGRETWEEVDEKNIKTINFLRVFNRRAVTPERHPTLEKNENFLMQDDFCWDMSHPTHYRLSLARNIGRKNTGLIHRSRILRFGGAARLLDSSRQRNQGWGNSVLETFAQPLARYDMAISLVASLLPEIIKKTWKIKGLFNMIISGQQEPLRKRVTEFAMMESSLKYRVIDGDIEDITESSLNFEGIFGAVEKAIDECVAASNLPRTYLLGVSPAGKLGESGGSEQTDMNKTVRQYQDRHIKKQLNRFHKLCWLAKDSPNKGNVPNGFRWNFVDTHPMKEKEKAEIFGIYGGTLNGYIQSQVLLPEEVANSVFGGTTPQYNINLDVDKRKKLENEQNAPPVEMGGDDAAAFEEEDQ